MIKQPMQPIVTDDHGTHRFHGNAIVRHLLDFGKAHGCGLNELAAMKFSQEDRRQFAQLVGYSLGGYGDLSYVSQEDYQEAIDAYHQQSGEMS